MSPDRLRQLLEEVPTPASEDARERTVAEARADVAGRGGAPRPSWSARHRRLIVVFAAALLVAALLTPPGRAASGWVGELVGIGEVGGSPTQEDRGFPGTSNPVVVDNGRAPDGTRYEWVAFGCGRDLPDGGRSFKGIGISLEWPGQRHGAGGASCEEVNRRGDAPASGGSFTSLGVHILPSQFKGVQEPDLVVSGTTGPKVHRVRVVYTDSRGERHELPVDFARVEGRLRELAGRRDPLGTFTAFVPGAWAARDEVETRLDLRALLGTGKLEFGPVARRERRAALEAYRECAPERPDPGALPDPQDVEAVERAMAPYNRCLDEELPPSPVEYVAYDAQGRELDRERELQIVASQAARQATEPAGREAPDAERARRPVTPDLVGEPVVLATGRAPDGALWELLVERFDGRSGRFACFTFWWPYVPFAPGGGPCAPDVVAPTAFQRRGGGEVAANTHGYLEAPREATEHLLLKGFARPQVARVRVTYRARGGGWRDAPVRLVRVRGKLLERLGADRPFGVFVTFVPRSVARHYGGVGLPGNTKGPAGVKVIAYDRDGTELSRVGHRN